MPALRKVAKELENDEWFANGGKQEFLQNLPHEYYEENVLHAILLADEKDFYRTIELTEKFLPYIDNWATCDFAEPKCFTKHKKDLLPHICQWIVSGKTYTVRYGIGMLMRMYLDEDFVPEYPAMVAEVISEEYYVNMMIAWYFATALAKQWESVISYLEEGKLSPWVHRKTIQKAIESYRVTPEHKVYLRTLR